ncbi:MAG: DUF512 domain-containing protein [Oscillospiraceae bacterium]|nr:DUF512 domain-containing protein [Oscillospiraceae bacterium]
MAVRIKNVTQRSLAGKAGVSPCDTLLKINGHAIKDVLDYRYYVTERELEITVESGGRARDIRITKREYDDIGLEFETYLMDKERFCKNKCIFCFIDQMPSGMRDSLYFKDDDSRLGFLFGNYITLTNLCDDDIDRIISMKTSPVNISVHTMNPDLRVMMMNNKNAGKSLRFIRKLTNAGISVNAQLVLCPGVNDGGELKRSLEELSKLAPSLKSIALVPVGLTKYRDGLTSLRQYTKEESRAVIETSDAIAEENLKKHKSRICYPSDEFYILAGIDMPDCESYGDFDQLENGVGMLRLLEQEFLDALKDEAPREVNRELTIATGVLAKPFIEKLKTEAEKCLGGLKVTVIAVKNRFFGESVTVAGLVTGADLIAELKAQNVSGTVVIPSAMLRHEGDLFLDGISVQGAEAALQVKLCAVKNDGYELLSMMIGG